MAKATISRRILKSSLGSEPSTEIRATYRALLHQKASATKTGLLGESSLALPPVEWCHPSRLARRPCLQTFMGKKIARIFPRGVAVRAHGSVDVAIRACREYATSQTIMRAKAITAQTWKLTTWNSTTLWKHRSAEKMLRFSRNVLGAD